MKPKKVKEPVDQSVAIRNGLALTTNWEEKCDRRFYFTADQMAYFAGMEDIAYAMKEEYSRAKTAEEFADNMKSFIHERLKFCKDVIPLIP